MRGGGSFYGVESWCGTSWGSGTTINRLAARAACAITFVSVGKKGGFGRGREDSLIQKRCVREGMGEGVGSVFIGAWVIGMEVGDAGGVMWDIFLRGVHASVCRCGVGTSR